MKIYINNQSHCVKKQQKLEQPLNFLCNITAPVLITKYYLINEDQTQPGNHIKFYFTNKIKKKNYKTIIKRSIFNPL